LFDTFVDRAVASLARFLESFNMQLSFAKYHGAGNDFIMVDDRSIQFPVDRWEWVRQLCERRMGVGADGLILVRAHPEFDFEMIYFNADGHRGSFCGNGARCAVHFWHTLHPEVDEGLMLASDGVHAFEWLGEELVQMEMLVEQAPETMGAGYFIDTGSPHYLQWFSPEAFDQLNFKDWAQPIRESGSFAPGGTNVNALALQKDGVISMRTFERGVEDETWSCGTGVTAAALLHVDPNGPPRQEVSVSARGGAFSVVWERTPQDGIRVFLRGPVKRLYDGDWTS